MSKTVTLRYETTCHDCGASLPVGTKAHWYGRGRVYGTTCHAKPAPTSTRTAYERGDRSPGAVASHYDRRGAYTADGAYLGTTGPAARTP